METVVDSWQTDRQKTGTEIMKTQLLSIEIYYNRRTGSHKTETVKQYGHSVCSIENAEHTLDRQTDSDNDKNS